MVTNSQHNKSVDELIQLTAKLKQQISEREQAERALAAQTEELRFLNTLNHAANRGDSLADISRLLADGVQSLLNATDVAVHYVNDDGTALVMTGHNLSDTLFQRIEAMLGFKLPSLKIDLTPDSFYTGLLASGKPAIIDTPEELTQLMKEYADSNLPASVPQVIRKTLYKLAIEFLRMGSAVTCPLIANQKAIGVLEILSRKPFSLDDTSRINRIAEQLSGIIARKRAETALQQSQHFYQSLVNSLPQAIYRKQRDGRFSFVNKNFCELSGHSAEELLGKSDFDIHPPDLAEKYLRDDNTVMDTGTPLQIIEERAMLGDEKDRQVTQGTKIALYNEAGEVIGTQGVFEDITQQKENELRLERYARQLDVLHQVDRAILTAQSPAEIAQAVLDTILHVIPARRASMVLMDQAQGIGTILAVGGTVVPAELGVGREVPLQHMPAFRQFLIAPEKTLQITLHNDDTPIGQSLRALNVAASLSVILTADNELIGSLNFGFANETDLKPEFKTIAEKLGDSLAVALQQARQAEQIRQDREIKTRLLQEVDHRVRNNLANIVGMLYLEQRFAKKNDQPITPDTLDRITARVRSLAVLHETLAGAMWQPIRLRDLISHTFTAAGRNLLSPDRAFVVSIAASDLRLPADYAYGLGMALHEIAAGLALYGMEDRSRMEVRTAIDTDDSWLTITFYSEGHDTYPTLAETINASLEMTLIRNTIEGALRGQSDMHIAPEGITMTVRLPVGIVIDPNTPK